jgi:hypothetical protein
VLCDSRSELSGDTVLEFMLTVKDGRLFEYTALTLRPQRICEAYDERRELIFRYKENVPVLSNLTGATRGVSSEELLFLSREYSPLAEDDQVEALGTVGDALAQLTSDGPNATRQELAADRNDSPGVPASGRCAGDYSAGSSDRGAVTWRQAVERHLG